MLTNWLNLFPYLVSMSFWGQISLQNLRDISSKAFSTFFRSNYNCDNPDLFAMIPNEQA